MAYSVTIDAGTSNTRVFLWTQDGILAGRAVRNIGVRNTAMDGNNWRLKAAVRDCLEEAVEKASITLGEVEAIVASGMLTSNLGLAEIPHLATPVSIADCAAGIVEKMIPEICDCPIHFIPGIRNANLLSEHDKMECMDMMRGEEAEAFALVEQYFDGTPMLLVLPGSHYKYVTVNEKKEITGCMTTMAGELLHVLTHHTIVADSVKREYVSPDHYCREWVLEGYQMARRVGFSRACFLDRIREVFTETDHQQLAAYLLGAVLEGEVKAVKNSGCLSLDRRAKCYLAGNEVINRALFDIFELEECFGHIVCHADSGIPLSSAGARLIAVWAGVL